MDGSQRMTRMNEAGKRRSCRREWGKYATRRGVRACVCLTEIEGTEEKEQRDEEEACVCPREAKGKQEEETEEENEKNKKCVPVPDKRKEKL